MGDIEGGAGPLGKVFAVVFILLIGFTSILVALSFPAGIYAIFGSGSGQDPWSAFTRPFLLLGPIGVAFPFTVPVGAYFIFLTLVYLALFAYILTLPTSGLRAISNSLRVGVGALTSSPILISLFSVAFLIFTATYVDAFAPSSPPSTTLLSLTQAPIIEEIGFRLLLIGVVPAILCLGLPWRRIVGVLWKPSSGYAGRSGAGMIRIVVIALLVASSVVFGAAHVLNGWSFGKLYEATYGGLVLGFLYVRYGFAFAVVAHWGIDYFDTVYSYLGLTAYHVPLTAQPEFFLQAAVDVDMVQLLGVASFLLAAYLCMKKLQERSRLVDKDLIEAVFGI